MKSALESCDSVSSFLHGIRCAISSLFVADGFIFAGQEAKETKEDQGRYLYSTGLDPEYRTCRLGVIGRVGF